MSGEGSDGSNVAEEGSDDSDVSEVGSDGSVVPEENNYEVIQRTLRPITLAFDIKSRFHFEDNEEVIVTQPFDPNNIPEQVEGNLIEVNMQMASNLERLPLFLETNPKTIFSTSIVGWMQMPDREMILATTRHWTREERYTPPLTDILFPVLVTKVKEFPIPSNEYMVENCKHYYPGMYLVLMGRVESSYLAKITLEINPPNNPTFNVITFRAVLKKYLIYIENNMTFIESQTTFNQIVDKLNEEYGIFGLYAGGPLPPIDDRTGIPRLCWDQPRDQQTMSGIFRFDSFEGRNKINGIICSRDALLEVKEKVSERDLRFSSLLKESSFVISDGNLTYAVNNGSKNWDYSKMYLHPNLLVAPEGFSSLNIMVQETDPSFRFACYWLENNAKKPLFIKWTQFQHDFNVLIGAVDDTPVFTEIMRLKDFKNYQVYQFNYKQVSTALIFSLAQRPVSRMHRNEYLERIHVYGSLPKPDSRTKFNNYFYLGTVLNFFHIQKHQGTLVLEYHYTINFTEDRLYPLVGIEQRLSAILSDYELNIAIDLSNRFNQMAYNVRDNKPLKELFKRFTDTCDIINQTQIGFERSALLKNYRKPLHWRQ